jgi:hypothetical protein
MDVIPREVIEALGTEITSLRGINRLPFEIKERVYASLIPLDLFASYGVDRFSLMDREGQKALQFDFPPETGNVKIAFRRSRSENDPIVFIQLSDTRYEEVEFEWIIINDPDSERFNINRLDRTQFLPPESEFRYVPEEVRAMEAGLAPGQIRRGLHKFHEIMDLLESLLSRIHIPLVKGYPYAYHNAIELERFGYFYTSEKERMLDIDREFHFGGPLFNQLDESTPFRRRGMERTVRGRSWAIHDGLMARPWICPTMIKITGNKARDYTFPDALYWDPSYHIHD